MRKYTIYFLILMLIMSFFPDIHLAEELNEYDITNEQSREQFTLFTSKQDGTINVYADDKGEHVIDVLQNDQIVEIDSSNLLHDGFILIYYKDENEEEQQGYINEEHIVKFDETETDEQLRETDDNDELLTENEDLKNNEDSEELERTITSVGFALKQPVHVYENKNRSSKVLKSYNYGEQLKYRFEDEEWHSVTVYVNGEQKQGYISMTDVGNATDTVTGIASENKTNIYSKTDTKSSILKSYESGTILKYRLYKKDWFIATVYVKGERKTGYIYAKDVVTALTFQEQLRGVSLNDNTKVYEKATTSSKVLRTYKEGHVLKFRSFTDDWYEATVKVNGKSKTGYIHKSDVELVATLQEQFQGVSAKNHTKVYEAASRTSKVLRTYNYGHILKYRTFTNSWYEATIIVNGKAKLAYIHKDDVQALNKSLTGYSYQNPTIVYSDMSTTSDRLKEYSFGAKLTYIPHTNEWFKATVFINGIKQNGYIQTKDVGPIYPVINGYAHSDPTIVYTNTSKKSKQLRSYQKGASLKYEVHNTNWYKATVIINGKRQIGFIHKDDVGLNPPSFYGYSKKSPTAVYASTSRSSKRLKTYQKGSRLKYQLHSKYWYKVTVIVNGKSETGYIHKSDIGKVTDISFVNPMKTYTYDTLVNDIKDLQKAYPDLISYHVVGKSEYGRDIYAVSLGKGKAKTFINGSIHAREWISTSLNMYMLENYAKAYKTNRSIQGYNARNILNNTTIWFMPMVNPDGVTLQQRGLNAFPKKDHAQLIKMNGGSRNFKRWKANAKGVDVNRNFSVGWKNVKNNAKGPSFQNYKGNKPLSSKEAQAVAKFVNEIKPQMTVNYHTSGRVLYWQYKQRGSRLTHDRTIARQISKMTGYQMLSAGSDPSGGGFLQWFTETQKGPSITPELAPYAGPTNVPVSRFSQIWRENQAVGLYAAQQSYNMYRK